MVRKINYCTKIILFILVHFSCSFQDDLLEEQIVNNNEIRSITFSPNDEMILFSYFLNNKECLYTSNIDGTNVRLLFEPEENYSLSVPRFSLKGDRILFIEFSENNQNNLYIAESPFNKSNKIKIIENDFFREAIFLNDNIIYCKANEYKKYSPIGKELPHNMDIYLYNFLTKKEHKLTNLNAYSISFLNRVNGDTILFNLDNEMICMIDIRNPLKVNKIKVDKTPLFLSDISYSSFSNQIVFADSYNIYLTNKFGGSTTKIIGPNDFHINNLILLNNSKRIAYTKDTKWNSTISFFDLEKGNYEEITITAR